MLGHILTYMLCSLGIMFVSWKSKVYVWSLLMLQVATTATIGFKFWLKHVHVSCYSIFLVNIGNEADRFAQLGQYVRYRRKLFEICIVHRCERLNCNVPDLMVEDRQWPPLRS